MKTQHVVRLFFSLSLLLLSHNATAIPKIQYWLSDNQVPVYLISAMDLPMLDIKVLFDAGSARDGDKAGLSSLTQTLSLESAGGFSTDELAIKLDSIGAILSGGVNIDMTSFHLRSLTQADILEKGLDVLLLALTQADFIASDFTREQKRTLVSLEYEKQSPASLASRAFFKQLYQDHPYGQATVGNINSVSAMKVADLKAFYQQHYTASNAKIVLVGAVDLVTAKRIAQKIAKKLPIGKKLPEIPAVTQQAKAITQHIAHPSSQTHVYLGQLGYNRTDADYFPLYIANHVLGGSGLVSKLSQEIREKRGLVYSVYSYFAPRKQAGFFLINLQTANKNAEKAINLARKTLQDFVNVAPTQAELDKAKQNLTGGFALNIDSNSKLASYVAMIAFYDKPLDYLENWTNQINAVTLAEIKDALKRRIHPEQLVLITSGSQ